MLHACYSDPAGSLMGKANRCTRRDVFCFDVLHWSLRGCVLFPVLSQEPSVGLLLYLLMVHSSGFVDASDLMLPCFPEPSICLTVSVIVFLGNLKAAGVLVSWAQTLCQPWCSWATVALFCVAHCVWPWFRGKQLVDPPAPACLTLRLRLMLCCEMTELWIQTTQDLNIHPLLMGNMLCCGGDEGRSSGTGCANFNVKSLFVCIFTSHPVTHMYVCLQAVCFWQERCSPGGYELPLEQEVTQYWLALHFLCADSPLLLSGCLPPPLLLLLISVTLLLSAPTPSMITWLYVGALSSSSRPGLSRFGLAQTWALTATVELDVLARGRFFFVQTC